jgi:hypothetical protein
MRQEQWQKVWQLVGTRRLLGSLASRQIFDNAISASHFRLHEHSSFKRHFPFAEECQG